MFKNHNLATTTTSKQKFSILKQKHTTDRDELISKYESQVTKFKTAYRLQLSRWVKNYESRLKRSVTANKLGLTQRQKEYDKKIASLTEELEQQKKQNKKDIRIERSNAFIEMREVKKVQLD